ncbi:mitofusin complex protein UGO1 [Aspergillus undulatus]|uniref:mitofusin complex protein UGO1 n=1 Tax=Aspergillus undulatus TaxID=1810928 RepID=UPI003CCC9ABF
MSSRDGPNPLRPYYIPPSIGLDQDASFSSPPNASSAQVFGNTARDLLPDIDYSEYLDSSPSVSGWVRDAFDTAIKRYTSVLMSQPFDVAKTILQSYVVPDDSAAGQFPKGDSQRSGRGSRNGLYDDMGSDEDEEGDLSSDDESSYFTSAAPAVSSPDSSRRPSSRRRITDRSGYIPSSSSSESISQHALALKNPSSLMEVLSQLWTTSGPTSPWKATNATFVYSLLLPTLNTFIRSLLSAIVGLPEDDITPSMASDILTSTSPLVALVLSFISSSLSAMLLSPIDTARTYLILTPATHGPRSLLRAIRQLPTSNYTIPPHLVPITILHSSLPNLVISSTPLILKSYLALDPVLHPSTWNILSFIGSGIEQAVRFPLETILRRAQIATFTSPSIRQNSVSTLRPTASGAAAQAAEVETIVPTPQTYRGVVGTMWSIVYEEGVQPSPEAQRARELLGKPVPHRKRQGQGIQGLYRGWRIGMWGVAGSLGLNLLNGAGGVDDGPMPSGGRF